MTNVEAVAEQLEGVEVMPGLQRSARSLAAVMDETSSARDVATIARQLRQTLVAVGEAHEVAVEAAREEELHDPSAELQARYQARLVEQVQHGLAVPSGEALSNPMVLDTHSPT